MTVINVIAHSKFNITNIIVWFLLLCQSPLKQIQDLDYKGRF